MKISWQDQFSEGARCLYGSMTRKLMDVLGDPEFISFGGGLPAWDLFPVEQVREITNELLTRDGPKTLQYGNSEGYGPLREEITKRYRGRGFEIAAL